MEIHKNLKGRRRWYNYILRHPLQNRVIIYSLLLLVAVATILFLVFQQHIQGIGRIAGQIDKPGREYLVDFILSNDFTIFSLGIVGGLIILCFVIVVFISHKFVGPIVHLERHFRELAERKSYENVSFRRHDQLKVLAQEINHYLNSIKPQE